MTEKQKKELEEIFEDKLLKTTLICKVENEKYIISVWRWNYDREYETIIYNKKTDKHVCFNSKYCKESSTHKGSMEDFIKELD